ncbi:MAG: hypothetical protein KKD05_02535 [Candidatus Omnitrophica bacterium]|nr:hypothetical protein [Candidatus Omnitrophota bacterium]
MNYSSKDYLSHSEERISRLRKIINGRPVAILAAGPSIKELEERISELRHTDICYLGLNKFFVQENNILQKIDKKVSIFTCSGREGMPEVMNETINFLNRNEDNMFISSFWRDSFGLLDHDFNLEQFLRDYDKKVLFFSLNRKKNVPNNDYPLHFIETNSLLILIQMAQIGRAESIVLFGADGHGGENVNEYYYRQNEYEVKGWNGVNEALISDTMRYFNPIASFAIRNTCKTYGLPLINILNCSLNSCYTPFPKISYDGAFEYLLKGKKVIGKLDLRVPRKPKMPNAFVLFAQKIVNFWKRYKWSSFRLVLAKVWHKLMTF